MASLMQRVRALRTAFLAVVLACVGLAPAWAGAPQPVIEKAAKGEQCVEDTDYMRKNHMKVLNHHRDKTVIEGVRTKKHSLKECINCHASQKTGSVAKSPDNFCVSCHAYAAVKIDCFECHSTKPEATAGMKHPLSAGAAHYQHKLAAQAKNPVTVEEMAGAAK